MDTVNDSLTFFLQANVNGPCIAFSVWKSSENPSYEFKLALSIDTVNDSLTFFLFLILTHAVSSSTLIISKSSALVVNDIFSSTKVPSINATLIEAVKFVPEARGPSLTGVTLPTLTTLMTFGCVATELNSATWNVVAEPSGVVTISSASLVSTRAISIVTSSNETK